MCRVYRQVKEINMPTALIFVGIIAVVYGVLKVSGLKEEKIAKDSDLTKNLFTESSRYFIGRYWSGFGFIIVGLGVVAFAVILYMSK